MKNLIGSIIKDLRKRKRILQKDLICDILNRSVLSEIENNKMYPSIPQLYHISNKLQVPINYFFLESSEENITCTVDIDDHYELKDLFCRKDYLKIVELYELGKLKLCRELNKCFYIGIAYFHLDLYPCSLKILKKYLKDYSEFTNDNKGKFVEDYATALNIMSFVLSKNSNYIKIYHYLYLAKQALEKHDKIKSRIYFTIINNLGAYYCLDHKYSVVIKILEEFLKNNKDLFYLSILPSIHLSLNIAYYRTNKFDEAIYHIKKSIIFFEYMNKEFDAAECYLNYINSLRFKHDYNEVLLLINQLKIHYKEDQNLINLFKVQEMVVYFNLKKFDYVMTIAKELKIEKLRKRSKMDYYFIIGHSYFLDGNYKSAYYYLKRCEKYFIGKKYYLDLKLLSEDMEIITGQNIQWTELYNDDKSCLTNICT